MTFTAIPEQVEAKRLLAAALAEGPAHAYLFHGPRGVGKRSAAIAFAAELLGAGARQAAPPGINRGLTGVRPRFMHHASPGEDP